MHLKQQRQMCCTYRDNSVGVHFQVDGKWPKIRVPDGHRLIDVPGRQGTIGSLGTEIPSGIQGRTPLGTWAAKKTFIVL